MAPTKKAGVLGATGSVGQRFILLLSDHPDFELSVLGASKRSAGKPYADAPLSGSKPRYFRIGLWNCCAGMSPENLKDCDVVFSGR